MWLGFFAWYRGLSLGGTMRVSQVQVVQPFLTMLLAVPILGEPLDPAMLAFAAAVVAVVVVGRRMSVGVAHRRPSPASKPVAPPVATSPSWRTPS
jgi:drug/metabolite transporter (DMT)-like permease